MSDLQSQKFSLAQPSNRVFPPRVLDFYSMAFLQHYFIKYSLFPCPCPSLVPGEALGWVRDYVPGPLPLVRRHWAGYETTPTLLYISHCFTQDTRFKTGNIGRGAHDEVF